MEVARRDTLTKEIISQDKVVDYVSELMDKIQENLFLRADKFRTENTCSVDTWEEFEKAISKKEGGFINAHWDGTAETEDKIKELTKATIRCIPLDAMEEDGKCILTGKPSSKRVIFAKAY